MESEGLMGWQRVRNPFSDLSGHCWSLRSGDTTLYLWWDSSIGVWKWRVVRRSRERWIDATEGGAQRAAVRRLRAEAQAILEATEGIA